MLLLKKESILITVMVMVLFFTLVSSAIAYNEAPMLKKLVAEGKLPPVEERLPKNPKVVEPIESIGKYGGTAHTSILNIQGWGDDYRLMSQWCGYTQPSADMSTFVPNLGEMIPSDDYKVWTLKIREGVKWSDGHPHTADDFMFWYEDVLLNKDITPTVRAAWRDSAGEIMKAEKIDTYTIKLSFSTPNPLFESLFYMVYEVSWPKHYLKQFHPKYTSKDKLEKLMNEEGYDNWYQLFDAKADQAQAIAQNPDLPTLAPFKLVKITSDRRIHERNPYFWKVDSEGNQLPYIDRLEAELASNTEVYNGKIISGEVDFAGFRTQVKNYPMYKNYEDKGNYRALVWKAAEGTAYNYSLALTHKDPVLREIFQDVRFRRALSLGINRKGINDALFFGEGIPSQGTISEMSPYFKPEYRTAYVEYDVERAKQLLDEMGLDKKNAEGIRLGPDGKPVSFTFEHRENEANPVQMIAQDWRELGLNVNTKTISNELMWQRGPSNLMDATAWVGTSGILMFPSNASNFVPLQASAANIHFNQWSIWYLNDGEKGLEPPENVKQLIEWHTQIVSEPDDEKRMELASKILESQAENLWFFGAVGEVPHIVIANKDLRNIPERGVFGYEATWLDKYDPEQIYFDR